MAQQLAVADVERLVVDEQPDDLAVGDVDDRLAVLGVAVAGLGVRQRARLVEAVEVGARAGRRLALVEVAAQADVAVGEREHRLGLREAVEVAARVSRTPHGSTVEELGRAVAPAARRGPGRRRRRRARAARRPGRRGRRRRRSRSRPARPASTPASASSKTAACAGSTPSAAAPARNVSGAGLPFRPSLLGDVRRRRAPRSGREPGDLEHVLGVGARGDDRACAGRRRAPPRGSAPSPRRPRRRPRGSSSGRASFLRSPERRGRGRVPRAARCRATRGRSARRRSAACRRRTRRSRARVELAEAVAVALAQEVVEHLLPRRLVDRAVCVSTPSRSNSRAVTPSGRPSIARVYAPRGGWSHTAHELSERGRSIGAPGFEPGTSPTRTARATRLRHAPMGPV